MVVVDISKATPSQEEGGPVLSEEMYQQAQDLGLSDNAKALGGHPTAEEHLSLLVAKNEDPTAVFDYLCCNIFLVADQHAGLDLMMMFHLAAQSTTSTDAVAAMSCVSALLLQGSADPWYPCNYASTIIFYHYFYHHIACWC